ncbi:MAG TPA: SDR family mycofactocin-dependent oxidoreductase [Microbacterium sp.]|jgi:(+)-trans-carveol dehydrogenase|uniref:mycofactocin-coupled SDR family oxidoreductase n=1 Tax=unclassified Microbacterium TaxID=2609290 RepID=UPI000C495A5E|nr:MULTISPECIES: mycofactocin-coupled SDR family oxidoreductase [unclassified Microbacterium]MBU19117.1 SDR family mycofactocin-dependent oxidoreductase [Microbacterium sp.]HAM12362.1 SDR family mycofactocin-dependent oxidoreductase [Microbacterium sp.]HBS07655.1 SDR family mycofactocin-dependent oxidoreductase [Microbacterium sp.]HBU44072.1 SDR family mycofactocin-dependent oxidoreductase [Microbacterium sp.]|tara:strand:- start:667 stop:1494 length:828 start_codon:yes stop_codon:yes gene_type:complete
MGRLDGKVAFITGAARGQGRSHAIRMAQEGADIIAIDLAAQIGTVPYAMATPADLDETVRQVEALDRRIVASIADVRDYDAVKSSLDAGVAQLGHLDIVSANAGIESFAPAEQLTDEQFTDMLQVNLMGVWHAAKAAVPHLRAAGGGSMIFTSSFAGLAPLANNAHYTAAKHGVVGLMRVMATELAPDNIRVNTVNPTMVNTDMVQNEFTHKLFRPDRENPTMEEFAEAAATINLLPIPWVEPIDISNAVLWLASDEARYVTGITLPIDAGALLK